jgi:hypothetical protein
MEPTGSFRLSKVPNNCSVLSQIDPLQVQTTYFPKIRLNIILPIYAYFYQVFDLHQLSLTKPCSYDITNPKINTKIKAIYSWPTLYKHKANYN